MAEERWAPVNNRWGDAIGNAHLLRADNSPSCGATYFACSGPYPGSENLPRCGSCTRTAEARRKKEAKQRAKTG